MTEKTPGIAEFALKVLSQPVTKAFRCVTVSSMFEHTHKEKRPRSLKSQTLIAFLKRNLHFWRANMTTICGDRKEKNGMRIRLMTKKTNNDQQEDTQ